MINDFVYDEMIEVEADGVDFLPIFCRDKFPLPIIKSFTKEEWLKEKGVLKTDRLYWKLDEQGNKVYIKDLI